MTIKNSAIALELKTIFKAIAGFADPSYWLLSLQGI
jgi:hypothetical protein